MAKDQLIRHADVLQAETRVLERKIALKNNEVLKKKHDEVMASWYAAEGVLVAMF